jgi:hypothetical protein
MTQDFSKLGEDNQNLQAELQRSRDSISRQEALIKQLNSRYQKKFEQNQV